MKAPRREHSHQGIDDHEQRTDIVPATHLPQHHPGQLLHSSEQLTWHGLLVHTFRNPPAEARLPGVPGYWVIMQLHRPITLERRVAGRLQRGPVPPGAISLVPLLAPTEWVCREPAEVLHIHLDPDFVTDVAREALDRDPPAIELRDHFALFDPLMQQIGAALHAEVQHGGVAGRVYAESLAHTLTVHLLRTHSDLALPSATPAGSLSSTQLRAIRSFIDAHLDQDVSLAQLAALVHMSAYHFARLFKRATGMAPHQYVINCRIERAKHLLAREQLSIGEVAARCGFFDQSHLTRTFTRAVGLTPRLFQQQRKNMPTASPNIQDEPA